MSRDFVQALWEKLGGEGPAPWHANQPADDVVKAIYALTGADGITIDVVDWHGGTLRWEVTLRGEFYEWPVVVAPTLVEALLWSVEAKPKPLRGSGGLIAPADPGAPKNPPSPRIPGEGAAQ